MAACPNCGGENSAEARFCQHCGTALQVVAPAREVRKIVTVLFADVTGSTALGEQLDPESLRDVMGRYFDAARTVIERHGGTVEKFIGDAVMAVFGIPRLHEDDALRAVRAAAELRTTLDELNRDLEAERGVTIAARTGVNTGEVVAGDPRAGQRLVTGDAVNVAARLEQAAQPGEILVSDDTFRLVRDAVEVEPLAPLPVKGKSDPLTAHRLVRVRTQAAGLIRHLDSRMVGRSRELLLLRQAIERAVSDRACQLFTVLGAAGVGKSRLVEEFASGSLSTGQAAVLRGRCLSYGEGITFWPVAEVVREAAGIGEADVPVEARTKLRRLLDDERDGALIEERLAQMIGLADAHAIPEETFWAVRKLFETLARRDPLVVVVDDIHWAEPTLLDLIEHVADWTREAPLLLLATARPELLDRRPAWGGGKLNTTTVLLEPLTEAESDGLVDNLLGSGALAPGARTKIVEAAEGNPLFVEQLVAMLIDDGHLRPEDGHWVPATDLSTVRMPSSIQALLAARLDQLAEQERMAAERASIEGKVFHAGGVVALAPDAQKSHMRASLMALMKKELIRPDRPELPGEDAFRFRHLLIRDAAYQAMPKHTRAELHEQFADWLAQAADKRLAEYEEILGYHLEQAYRLRSELGPVDERGRTLAAMAGQRLAAAGRRAADRGDGPAAMNLLQRAADLLPETDPARMAVLYRLFEEVVDGGDFERSNRIVAEGLRLAGDDEHLRTQFEIAQAEIDFLRADVGFMESVEELVARAFDVFERHDDLLGLARTHRMLAIVHWTACRFEAVHDDSAAALDIARRLGDERLEAEMIDIMLGSSFWGPMPREELEAEAEAFAVYAENKGGRRLQAAVEGTQAGRATLDGRFEDVPALLERRRPILDDLGRHVDAIGSYMWLGSSLMLKGDPVAAVEALRTGVEAYEAMGERGFNSTMAANLAEALFRAGRFEESLHFADLSREITAEGDLATQYHWRMARALTLSAMGQPEEAEHLAREAVAIAEESDSPIIRGPAWEALGQVMESAGRRDDAVNAYRRALDLYESKGSIPHSERARGHLAAVEARD